MRILLALASALAATSATADTIEATSTTYVSSGKQTRGGLPGQSPDLVDVLPVVEVLTLSARGIRNPVFENLEIVVSTWGSVDLQDKRWDAGTNGDLTGDVMTGYLRGQLLSRRLTLRLGRQLVSLGAGRVASIDGGDVALKVPGGFGLDVYAGAPVAQRFSSRDALRSWNPLGGDLAYGGRFSWGLSLSNAFLRGFELGLSAALVTDESEWVRRDAGADARLRLFKSLALNGHALYSLVGEEPELADASALATWQASRHLFVTADYRYSAPHLMLPQTSILTVFANSTRNDVGGGLRYELTRSLEAGVDYHALLEPDGEEGTELGHEVAVRGDYASGPIHAGAELTWLSAIENGYLGARFFVRREIGRFFATGDLLAYVFDEPVNEQDYSASFGATCGYKFGKAWTAGVSARAAVTPFMEQQVDVMAKLAYNQTYRVREVR
jgi:hypothetical protein